MSTKALAVTTTETGYQISVPPEALRIRQEALAACASIIKIETHEEQAAAIVKVAKLKAISKQTEGDRAAIKQPFWDAGKAIDSSAKDYVRPVDTRVSEIESLLSDFQRKENARLEAIRQEKERQEREKEEADRKERERLQKEENDRLEVIRIAEKAEADRIAAEEAAKDATTKREQKAAQDEVNRLQEISDDAAAAALQAENDQLQAEIDAQEKEEERQREASTLTVVNEPIQTKAAGQSTRERLEYEITDIEALYAWDNAQREKMIAVRGRKPLLTIIKMAIVDADFRAALKTLTPKEIEQIPGINISKSTKVSVKAIQYNLL